MSLDGPIQILYVDDDTQFAELTREQLEAQNEDFEVSIEHDGEAALTRLSAEGMSIDCLLADYQMPSMDGLELLRAVRQQFPEAALPYILLTSEGNEAVAAEALNAGASSYIQKGGPETYAYISERIRRDVQSVRSRQSRTRFEALSQALGDPVYLMDDEGSFLFVNDAFVELVGYDRDALLTSDHALIKDQAAVSKTEQKLRRLRSDSDLDSVTFEIEVQPANGPPIPCEDHIGTLPPESDTFEGSIGVLRDISDRLETEERLEAIVRNSPDLISVLDADGRVIEESPAIQPMLGYAPGELEGELAFEYVHQEDRDRVMTAFDTIVEEPGIDTQRVEYRFKHSDGSWRWLESIGTARAGDRLEGYIIISRDITERKDRERRFRRTLKQMQKLIRSESRTEAARSAVRIADSGISLPYAGMHLESDDGSTLTGVAGNPTVDDHFDEVPSYDRTDGDREVDQLIWNIYASGEQVVINDIPASDKISTTETPMRSTIIQPVPEQGVFIASADKPDCVDDIDRILIKMLATNLEAVFERLEHNEHIERQRDDLEVLNQVLRHDIRNDLQVISAHLKLLSKQLDQPDVNEHIQTAMDKTKHASELTETARQIADAMLLDDETTAQSNLRATVMMELDSLRSSYPDATVSVEGSIPDVQLPLGDLLDSVIGNILNNAVQHNDAKQPTVTVRAERRDGHVIIEIADNGPGIPDSRKSEIFGKGEKGLESSGSGMGLFLVETLLSRCGGSVYVEDNDPSGTVFVLELPVANED